MRVILGFDAYRLAECCLLWLNFTMRLFLVHLSLQLNSVSTVMKVETDLAYQAVSIVTDRSILSDEMALMCAKLPIYLVKARTTAQRKSSRAF